MTRHEVDLVVLGGGSGGYAAALRAAELGSSVVLIEKDKVGGTCLHRGCVPTKALLHTAEVADLTREAAAVGVEAIFEGMDVARIAAYRDGIVAKKFAGLTGLVSARGISVVSGEGVLTAERTVVVAGDEYVGAHVVLATGASARNIPGLPEDARIITSDGALTLDRVPAHALVLGGGVIGVEFASLWRSFGAQVTIVEALPRLLPTEDEAMSAHLQRAFRKRGITVHTGTRVTGAVPGEANVAVTLDDGSVIEADTVLVAVGRAPATAGLGLEAAGVAVEGGFVQTDELLRTTARNVWAVGDIVRGPQLAHRGFQQGILVAELIAGKSPSPVPDATIPRVSYSHPEVASVGLTEADARAQHGTENIATVEYNLAGNARSAILGTAGLAKVVRVVDGPVIGVHLIGDRVGELITEAQLVIGWEAHPEDVAPFIHAHPTQSEALGEAFLALAGKPLHTL